MVKKTMIDPALGWKYGFPKVYDNPDNLSMKEWLIKNGYPEKELNKAGEAAWVRTWEEEDEEPVINRGAKL
jgi:hypothetical protein